MKMADAHIPERVNMSFSVVAALVKGKRRINGCNRIDDPASVHAGDYPDICGRHAEQNVLELCERGDVELRGTLYVVGVRNNTSRNPMRNTAPCQYCRKTLASTKIRRFVYISDGEFVKELIA